MDTTVMLWSSLIVDSVIVRQWKQIAGVRFLRLVKSKIYFYLGRAFAGSHPIAKRHRGYWNYHTTLRKLPKSTPIYNWSLHSWLWQRFICMLKMYTIFSRRWTKVHKKKPFLCDTNHSHYCKHFTRLCCILPQYEVMYSRPQSTPVGSSITINSNSRHSINLCSNQLAIKVIIRLATNKKSIIAEKNNRAIDSVMLHVGS